MVTVFVTGCQQTQEDSISFLSVWFLSVRLFCSPRPELYYTNKELLVVCWAGLDNHVLVELGAAEALLPHSSAFSLLFMIFLPSQHHWHLVSAILLCQWSTRALGCRDNRLWSHCGFSGEVSLACSAFGWVLKHSCNAKGHLPLARDGPVDSDLCRCSFNLNRNEWKATNASIATYKHFNRGILFCVLRSEGY